MMETGGGRGVVNESLTEFTKLLFLMQFSMNIEVSYSGSGLPSHKQPPIKLEEQIRHKKHISYSLPRNWQLQFESCF